MPIPSRTVSSRLALALALFLTTSAVEAQPTVTISATDPSAIESPTESAECQVARSGDFSNPLTVDLRVLGSARAGEDFSSLPDQVTVPADELQVAFSVNPLDDAMNEGPETILVEVLPGAGYSVSPSASSCKILLYDDENVLRPILNELLVDAAASDDEFEFVELHAQPETTWSDLYLLVLEGDDGPSQGVADYVLDLSSTTFGDDGLLPIIDSPSIFAVQSDTFIQETGFPLLENGSLTLLLVESSAELTEGTDYDTDDNGQLDLPVGAEVLDSLAWSDGGIGDHVYAEVVLIGTSGAPDAATRFLDSFASEVGSWYWGEHASAPGNSDYDTSQVSNNFPANGVLTPTTHNTGSRILFIDGFESGDTSAWAP